MQLCNEDLTIDTDLEFVLYKTVRYKSGYRGKSEVSSIDSVQILEKLGDSKRQIKQKKRIIHKCRPWHIKFMHSMNEFCVNVIM